MVETENNAASTSPAGWYKVVANMLELSGQTVYATTSAVGIERDAMTHGITFVAAALTVLLSGLAVGYLHYSQHKDYADVVVEHVAMRALKIADTVNTIKWHQPTNTTHTDSMSIAYANVTNIATPAGCPDNDMNCMREICNKVAPKSKLTDPQCRASYIESNMRTYFPTKTIDDKNFVKRMQQYAWSVEYHLTGFPQNENSDPSIVLRLNERDLYVTNSRTGKYESLATWGRADGDQITKCQRAYKSQTDVDKNECTLYLSNSVDMRPPIVVPLGTLEQISKISNTTERERMCFEECDLQLGLNAAFSTNRDDLITSCMLLLPVCSTVTRQHTKKDNNMVDSRLNTDLTTIENDCWARAKRSYSDYNNVIRYTWYAILAVSALLTLLAIVLGCTQGGKMSSKSKEKYPKFVMFVFLLVVVGCVMILIWGGLYSNHYRHLFEHKVKKPHSNDNSTAPIFHDTHCFGRHTAHTMGYTDQMGNWITLKADWANWNVNNKAWKDQQAYTTHTVLRGDRRMGHGQIMQAGPQMRAVHVSLAMASVLALVLIGVVVKIGMDVRNSNLSG